jgi:ketosteroid isomerase-like protein
VSQENVEIVREALDASVRGDSDAFMGVLDPDIEWTPVKDDPDYRVHRGLEDVGAWLAEWFEVFPDMRWEAEEILDAGNEMVVALVRMLGRGDATAAEVGTQVYGVVFTVRSGKIVRVEEADTETAFKIVGIKE